MIHLFDCQVVDSFLGLDFNNLLLRRHSMSLGFPQLGLDQFTQHSFEVDHRSLLSGLGTIGTGNCLPHIGICLHVAELVILHDGELA